MPIRSLPALSPPYHCLAALMLFMLLSLFFFFSSRRRHTRFKCDWSSDVCSSDLAGLHFDDALLAAIEARGAALARLTLHVGAGTFQPVRSDTVEAHRMHRERY